MKKPSRVTHHPGVRLPEGNRALVEPIYQSVKFSHPSIQGSLEPDMLRDGYEYTRNSNPTTRQLELLAAEIQDREDAVAVATGMAGVWLTLLGNLTSGDRVVFFLESYRPTRIAIRKFLPRLGIEHALLSIHDKAGMEREFADPRTRLVLFESPTNPMLQIADIEALTAAARRYDVVVAMDNTFAGLHNHGRYDIDYFIHSLTKYANGHGDTMGGIVIASAEHIRRIKPLAVNMGPTLDPHAAWLILRGLKTYYLRYRQHSRNAQAIAEYLEAHPAVTRVWYPGLGSAAGHELAGRQMEDFGGVLSFDLRAEREQTWAFIDALQMFATTASLGSTESLVCPVRLYLGSDLSAEELAASSISDSTVRLAVGVEDIDDLLGDLAQAFEQVLNT